MSRHARDETVTVLATPEQFRLLCAAEAWRAVEPPEEKEILRFIDAIEALYQFKPRRTGERVRTPGRHAQPPTR